VKCPSTALSHCKLVEMANYLTCKMFIAVSIRSQLAVTSWRELDILLRYLTLLIEISRLIAWTVLAQILLKLLSIDRPARCLKYLPFVYSEVRYLDRELQIIFRTNH
jgi:hypothetical protein